MLAGLGRRTRPFFGLEDVLEERHVGLGRAGSGGGGLPHSLSEYTRTRGMVGMGSRGRQEARLTQGQNDWDCCGLRWDRSQAARL